MNNFDTPKESIKEDELGYSYLAYYIAKIIKDINPINNAYVIGICGKWGDGKTTLINYIKEILQYSYKNNYKLDIDNYKNILNKIKNDNTIYDENQNKKSIDTFALIKAILILFLITTTLIIKFSPKISTLNLTDYMLIGLFIILLLNIPPTKKQLLNSSKELFFNFLSLFHKFENPAQNIIKIIDFNPWYYQRNEKEITQNFFKLLGQEIQIKEQNSNINLILQYASCLLNIKFPNIKCDDKNITNIKRTITKILKKENKKYLIIIDDLDRIPPQDVALVFKTVKLLADFPNIIYLLSYDKNYLTNQYPFQNSDYIQKIVQLEKTLPIIPPAKLKEICIKRLDNIINKNSNFNLNEFINIYDFAINKLIKNIRDINRFENSFHLSYIANQNTDKTDLTDYILISILEEFDKTTYSLIQQNKHLLFETISSLDLKKHTDFIQLLSKQNGFYIFIVLFANYLSKIEDAITPLLKTTSVNNPIISDAPKHIFTEILNSFQFKYKSFLYKDNYKKISNKIFFDNYFLTNTITSTLTDDEYISLTKTNENIEEFQEIFTDIFLKNEDKFKDFRERLSRDKAFINKTNNICNLIEGLLNVKDSIILKLFNLRFFCEDILSILKINRTITKHKMLDILLKSFNSDNIIQQIYWCNELEMSNIDEYFKTEKFKAFNIGMLKNKINSSNIYPPEDINILIDVLITCQRCNLKPNNFKDLTNKILTSKNHTIQLLKKCNTLKNCYYFFEFKEMQDILIEYYFETKNDYLNDRLFKTNIVQKSLNENLTSKKDFFINDFLKLTPINLNINSTIDKIKNSKNSQLTIIDKNNINNFIQKNIFMIFDKISENQLVVKYVLDSCFMNNDTKNKLENTIKNTIEIINKLQKLNLDLSLEQTNILKNKYLELYNSLL